MECCLTHEEGRTWASGCTIAKSLRRSPILQALQTASSYNPGPQLTEPGQSHLIKQNVQTQSCMASCR
jgi:hypothetical protein